MRWQEVQTIMDKVANKKAELEHFVERLRAGDRSPELKGDVQEFLLGVGPCELYPMEHELISAGLAIEDLVHRYIADMEPVREEMERLRTAVGSDHLMAILTEDHEEILDLLDELKGINDKVQEFNETANREEVLKQLDDVVERFRRLEPDHVCKEAVVYPELERHGELGPPKQLDFEHHESARLMKSIAELAHVARGVGLHVLQERLDPLVKSVVFIKRDHIFKEVYTIYPRILRAIPEPEVWARMKEECRKLGCRLEPLRK